MTMTNCPSAIVLAAAGLVETQPTERGCIIITPCLYPGGEAAQVTVKQTEGGYYVTDAGRGLLQVLATGHESQKPGLHIAAAAHAFSLDYSRGMIFLRDVEESVLDMAIALVANASVHGVVRTMEHFSMHNERNFKFSFDSYIRDTYGDKFKKDFVTGANQVHTLDYVHKNDKVVIVDPLQPDQMSVHRAFSAHFDIKQAAKKPDFQILVFDGDDPWKTENLQHLRSLGVEVLEYAEAQEKLPQYVPRAA
jgi:hypothetical protein